MESSGEVGQVNISEATYVLVKDVNSEWSLANSCLLYTSDAADERSSVDLGGRRIIKKKKQRRRWEIHTMNKKSEQNKKSQNDASKYSDKEKH